MFRCKEWTATVLRFIEFPEYGSILETHKP